MLYEKMHMYYVLCSKTCIKIDLFFFLFDFIFAITDAILSVYVKIESVEILFVLLEWIAGK